MSHSSEALDFQKHVTFYILRKIMKSYFAIFNILLNYVSYFRTVTYMIVNSTTELQLLEIFTNVSDFDYYVINGLIVFLSSLLFKVFTQLNFEEYPREKS